MHVTLAFLVDVYDVLLPPPGFSINQILLDEEICEISRQLFKTQSIGLLCNLIRVISYRSFILNVPSVTLPSSHDINIVVISGHDPNITVLFKVVDEVHIQGTLVRYLSLIG